MLNKKTHQTVILSKNIVTFFKKTDAFIIIIYQNERSLPTGTFV